MWVCAEKDVNLWILRRLRGPQISDHGKYIGARRGDNKWNKFSIAK